MLLLEDLGGGAEPDEPPGGTPRNHRIEELRRQVDQLRGRIAAAQAEQRRAVMELNELLEEKRRLARRARQQQRAARVRRDETTGPEADGRAAGGDDRRPGTGP